LSRTVSAEPARRLSFGRALFPSFKAANAFDASNHERVAVTLHWPREHLELSPRPPTAPAFVGESRNR
jgi:hypothetical protein